MFETARGVDEFLQVFHARFGLFAFFLFVVLDQSAAREHMLHHFTKSKAGCFARQALDQLQKNVQRLARARRRFGRANQFLRRLPQGNFFTPGALAHGVHGLRADPARWHVHNAIERRIVMAARDQAQIGERVLDLGTLEEAQASVYAVRNAIVDQPLLE